MPKGRDGLPSTKYIYIYINNCIYIIMYIYNYIYIIMYTYWASCKSLVMKRVNKIQQNKTKSNRTTHLLKGALKFPQSPLKRNKDFYTYRPLKQLPGEMRTPRNHPIHLQLHWKHPTLAGRFYKSLTIQVWYICIHEWLIFMVNVGKYTIHGCCGNSWWFMVGSEFWIDIYTVF